MANHESHGVSWPQIKSSGISQTWVISRARLKHWSQIQNPCQKYFAQRGNTFAKISRTFGNHISIQNWPDPCWVFNPKTFKAQDPYQGGQSSIDISLGIWTLWKQNSYRNEKIKKRSDGQISKLYSGGIQGVETFGMREKISEKMGGEKR